MLTWDWKNKIGEWKEEICDELYTFNIYKCNGLAVMLYEYTDDNGKEMYQMHGFFSDKEHLKNCLGLSKDYKENMYRECLKEVVLEECKEATTIAQHLVKAKWDNPIKITINPKAPF